MNNLTQAANGGNPYSSVPEQLTHCPNWVSWKLEPNSDGNPTKVPYYTAHEKASSIDPTTWRIFDEVCDIIPLPDSGIGFMFDGNGIVGIDLDHCFNDGILDPRFVDIINTLKTYTEISPSGHGLHLFIRCSEHPYPKGKKRGDFEIYSKERYFTVTGNQLEGTPNEILEYDVELVRKLCDPFVGTKPQESKEIHNPVTISNSYSDEDILSIISHSSNSGKFDKLWRGSISDHGNDRSRADMAMASILAFYTRGDANQIERIMRSSGLAREKWNTHKTYLRDITIAKAISDCREFYEPKSKGEIEHGEEVANILLSNAKSKHPKKQSLPVVVPIETVTDDEIDKIKKSLCSDLPKFPEIAHPLFKRWMDIGGKLMYSHTSYHFGNLLAIASMALGRRVSVLISTKHTYANCYVMLIGTSTISGKSFSSDTAIEEYGKPVTKIPAPVNPDDNTELKRKSCANSRLIQDLSKNNNMLWYYDEAKEFFDDSGDRGWNAPIIGTLCTAYDGGQLERSLSNANSKKGDTDRKWTCDNPFLSLLFNMTITQLKEASTPKILSSGFLFRWLWFLENGGEKKKNITASEEDLQEISDIRDELSRVANILKLLKPNDICFSVNDTIEQWSIDISKKNDNENFQSATGRGTIHIYKIAMILSIFDPEFQETIFNQPQYPIRVELPEKWVKEAIAIVETFLLPRMLRVIEYSECINVNNKQERVLNDLKTSGGCEYHSNLLKKTKLDKIEFKKAIETLIESDQIEKTTRKDKPAYKIKI